MSKKYVWQFTNQIRLSKSQFIDYFEKKIFKTIRKYSMLPKDRVIRIKKSDDINTIVLKKILEKKLNVSWSNKPNFSSENLSDASEETFKKILNGIYKGPSPNDKLKKPLYFISDKEIETYAKLSHISGKRKKRDAKIQELFRKFLDKNPDLEINIVNALSQLPKH